MKEHGWDENDQCLNEPSTREWPSSKVQMKRDPLLTQQLVIEELDILWVVGHWALFGRAVPNCRQDAGSTLLQRAAGVSPAETNASVTDE